MDMSRCPHLSALIGALETINQPLIVSANTSLKAWNTLASTYGKQTRGHIKQLKQQLRQSIKGCKTVDEYMQLIKTKSYGHYSASPLTLGISET